MSAGRSFGRRITFAPVDLDLWEHEILPYLPRPLTVAQAEQDLRHLVRLGALPGKRTLAARWGWEGDDGAERAARLSRPSRVIGGDRLRVAVPRWMDDQWIRFTRADKYRGNAE